MLNLQQLKKLNATQEKQLQALKELIEAQQQQFQQLTDAQQQQFQQLIEAQQQQFQQLIEAQQQQFQQLKQMSENINALKEYFINNKQKNCEKIGPTNKQYSKDKDSTLNNWQVISKIFELPSVAD